MIRSSGIYFFLGIKKQFFHNFDLHKYFFGTRSPNTIWRNYLIQKFSKYSTLCALSSKAYFDAPDGGENCY